jgi:CheY-like chemotaxis protein
MDSNRTSFRQPFRILLVDDSRVDRVWIEHALRGDAKRPGPLSGMDIVTSATELGEVADYESFHGIIFDWQLATTTGPDVAKRIREYNWKRPVLMLLTGASPDQIPNEVYRWFHYAVSKMTIHDEDGVFWWTFRRMVAHMAQVAAAYEIGRKDAIAEIQKTRVP